MTSDFRRGSIRRGLNDLIGMRGGEVQESKLFASIGKGLCIWLIWKHAEILIDHENTLFILLMFLILPDLAKKFMTMRFGGDTSTTEHVERTTTISKEETK